MTKRELLTILALFFTLILRGQNNVVAFPKVYAIFQSKCVSCHSNIQKAGGLDLEGAGTDKSGAVFTNLVNKTPVNAAASAKGHKLIYAGRVDRSFLFHKINGEFDKYYPALTSAEGTNMPQTGTSLTQTEKEIIRQWILYGATKTATIPEARIKEYYEVEGRALAAFDTVPTAPKTNEGFQIKMGPFFLAPNGTTGKEVEYYQKWELNLANNVEVNRIDHIFSNFSHHFILYSFTNNASAIPAGLRTDANHSNINLVSAVQEKTDLKLPNKTAFKWNKDRVLDLNAHYINYSANHIYKAEVYLNIYTQPTGTAKQEMFSYLIPNIGISIPNNNQTVTSEANFIYTGKVFVWGLMGHTHKYGTGYKVFKRLPNGTKGELLYDASCPNGVPGCASPYFDYQHIPMRFFQPLMPVELNPGFIHQATWKNNGDKTLTFGPTTDDEMMVMTAMFTNDTTGLTDIKENKELQNVIVYPNPMREKMTLILPPSVLESKITFYDMLGRAIRHEEDLIGNTIELQRKNLQTGIYLLRVEDEKGYYKTLKIRVE